MILIPEQKLKLIVDYILNYLTSDYKTSVNKEDSYLFELLGEYKDNEEYDYWKNGVALLTKPKSDSRKIETHFFLNRSRFTLPTVHITLNSDNPGADGIGFDRGWGQGENLHEISGREFNTRFQVVITSDNTFDTLIIYHVLMACFIGNNHLLTLNGIQNPSFKGGDIILNDQNNPTAIYARAIFIDCFYTLKAPKFKPSTDLVLDINFEEDRQS